MKVRGTVVWNLATALSVFWRFTSLASHSETTSNSTFRANASRFTPAYQPQPIIPTRKRGFDVSANSREPVATTAPAAASEETKVRLFMGFFTTSPLTLNLGINRAPQPPKKGKPDGSRDMDEGRSLLRRPAGWGRRRPEDGPRGQRQGRASLHSRVPNSGEVASAVGAKRK